MSLEKRLLRVIERDNIKSLTVDVFDTILLRRIWPEDLQFLKVAEKWQPLFEHLLPEITAYELYSYRVYAREELWTAGRHLLQDKQEYDVNLTVWFDLIISLMSEKYHVKIPPSAHQRLLNQMIEIELVIEQDNLKPNSRLLTSLGKIKQQTGVKIYFVSDMYLTTTQIRGLLQHFDVDIFDDGTSSIDAGFSKGGELFFHLADIFPKFNPFTNLHIGDNPRSDGMRARAAGCATILVRTGAKRYLKTHFGRRCLEKIIAQNLRTDAKTLGGGGYLLQQKSAQVTWQNFGVIFAYPLYAFLTHIGILAQSEKKNSRHRFLLVSSEAAQMKKYGTEISPKLFSEGIVFAEKLNRKTVLRALLYELSQQKNAENNLHALLSIFSLGENQQRLRYEIYRFLFDKDYAFSEMILNARSKREFSKMLLVEIQQNPSALKTARKARDEVRDILQNCPERITIVDVGWGGTIQALLTEFASITNTRKQIDGIYLGVHPSDRFGVEYPIEGYLLKNARDDRREHLLWHAIIWEYAYTRKHQYTGDTERQVEIATGFTRAKELWSKLKTNPRLSYEKILAPRIKRLICHPTMEEVKTLSQIHFDFGFAESQKSLICDLSRSRPRFWLNLLTHPIHTVRMIYKPNSWPMGYFKYYHLGITLPFLLTLRKLRRLFIRRK